MDYATFVAHTEATYAAPLPRYVTDAFERYLGCGDFSRGSRALLLRRLPPRRPRGLLVEATRPVPELRCAPHVRCRRYLDERPAEDRGNEPAAETPVDALARLALAGGTFLGRPFAPKVYAGENLDRKEPRFSAKHNGFDVHCAVRLAADDDEGRERLIRSFARPPFTLARIEEMKDGRISYAP